MFLVEVRMHDGTAIQEEVADYDLLGISEKMNSEQGSNMIVIGNAIISRHAIKLIRPIKDVPEVALPEINS